MCKGLGWHARRDICKMIRVSPKVLKGEVVRVLKGKINMLRFFILVLAVTIETIRRYQTQLYDRGMRLRGFK